MMSGGAGRKKDRMPKITVVPHQRPIAAVAPAAGRATTYHGDDVRSSGTAADGRVGEVSPDDQARVLYRRIEALDPLRGEAGGDELLAELGHVDGDEQRARGTAGPGVRVDGHVDVDQPLGQHRVVHPCGPGRIVA